MLAGTLDIQLMAGVARLEQDMRTARATVERTTSAMARAAQTAERALGAIGAGLSIGALVSFVKAMNNAVDALNDISDATGSAIEKISGLENVEKRFGHANGTATTALLKFNQALNATDKEGSDAAKVVKALGLNVEDLKRMDPADALMQTAKAMAQFADDGEKARAAQLLFGKSLREVAPLLKDMAEQGELVGTVTKKDAEEAEKFNRELFKMQTLITDTSRAIAGPMISAVNELIERFRAGQREGEGFFQTLMRMGQVTPFPALNALLGQGIKAMGWDKASSGYTRAREEVETLNKALKDLSLTEGERAAMLARRDAAEKTMAGYLNSGAGAGRGIGGYSFAKTSLILPPDDKPGKNRELEEQARLLAELLGVQADYQQQLARLQKMRASQNMTDERYVELVTELIKKQPGARKAIEEQTKAEQELVKARVEQLELAAKAREVQERAVDQLGDETKRLREEIELIGLNEQQQRTLLRARSEAIILTKEAELAQLQLASTESGTMTRREIALMEEIRLLKDRNGLLDEKAAREAHARNAQEALSVWERTHQQIGQSFIDALMDSGRTVADALRSLFRTLVLNPILAPLGNSFGAMVGTLPTAANAGSGLLGSVGSMLGMGGVEAGLGATLQNGIFSGFGANMANIGSMISGGSFGMALGSALPYLGMAAAALTLIGKQFKGETRSGASYAINPATGRAFKTEGPSGGELAAGETRAAIEATFKGINDTLKSLGATAQISEFLAGLETSERGKAFVFGGGQLSTGAKFGNFLGRGGVDGMGDMNGEQAMQAFALELKRTTLQALQAADVPGILGEYLRSLGDIAAMSGESIDAALARINKAMTERAQIEAAIFELTATDAQKLAKAREAELSAIDESNVALMERLHKLQDEAKAAEKAAEVAKEREGLEQRLLQLQGNTAELRRRELEALDPANRALLEQIYALEDQREATEKAAEAASEAARRQEEYQRSLINAGGNIWSFLRELTTTRAGLATPQELLANTRSAYLQDLGLARSGDVGASQRITQSAQAYIDAQKGMFASGGSTDAVINQIIAELRGLPAVKSFEEQQLDELRRIANLTQQMLQKLQAGLQSIAANFAELDVNTDGLLTFEELRAGLAFTEAELRALWPILDRNGDNVVSAIEASVTANAPLAGMIAAHLLPKFDQLTAATNKQLTLAQFQSAIGGLASDAVLKAIFTELDVNGDGVLSKLELINSAMVAVRTGIVGALGSNFEKLTAVTGQQLTLAQFQAAFAGYAKDVNLVNLFRLIDVDNDGIISKLEAINASSLTFGQQVQNSLASNFEKLTATTGGLLNFEQFRSQFDGLASEDALRNLFALIDADGDGTISRLEAIRASSQSVATDTSNGVVPTLGRMSGDLHNTMMIVMGQLHYDLGIISGQLAGVLWVRSENRSGPYASFATGAAFGSGVVMRPTMFDMGLMGEAGPEGILPLANVGGRLGVHASGGNDQLIAELLDQNVRLQDRVDRLTAVVAEGFRREVENTDRIADSSSASAQLALLESARPTPS